MILIDSQALVPLKYVKMKDLAEIKQQVRNLAMLTNNNLIWNTSSTYPRESWRIPEMSFPAR